MIQYIDADRKRGVIIVLFDVPNSTKSEAKDYRHFIKHLKKLGFLMFQESVYIKLVRNKRNNETEINYLNSIVPKNGSVSALPLSLSEFSKIRTVLGQPFDLDLFAADIVVIE